MSESNESSGGSSRQGGGRSNNRRRRGNPKKRSGSGSGRNSQNRRGSNPRSSGGGARSGGVEFSKMPRRKPRPSLWQRFLGIFGLAGSKPKPKAKASPKAASSKVGAAKTPRKKQAGAKKKVRRTPESVEVTTPRLYVGNLSYDAAESDLQELFTGVGTVSSVEVIYNARTQRSKGYAFVSMMSIDEAKRAVDELHDKEYMGRKMVVSGAKAPRKERDVA